MTTLVRVTVAPTQIVGFYVDSNGTEHGFLVTLGGLFFYHGVALLGIQPFQDASNSLRIGVMDVRTWSGGRRDILKRPGFGLRLGHDSNLLVVAPFGLDDLLGLVHRRNPARVSIDEYKRRLTSKRIAERWPRVTVVEAR